MIDRSSMIDCLSGIIVLLIALSFAVYSYLSVGSAARWIKEEYRVFAIFNQIDGLKRGADVRLSGVKIGNVVHQKLNEDYTVEVEIALDKNVILSKDTVARITSIGLFSDLYISIEPGGEQEVLTDGDDLLFTRGSVDMIGLFLRSLLGGEEEDSSAQ